MKTLFLITLLAITVICSGQDNLQLLSVGKDTTKPLQVFGRLVDLNTVEGRIWYNQNTYHGATYTFKKAEFTIVLDQFKVTDTIWIQSGKKKVGVPAWKFLALLGYTNDDEKLCPVCGKDFLFNTSCLRNKNGYIWEQYNCEHCG